jgi:hypothetical protein
LDATTEAVFAETMIVPSILNKNTTTTTTTEITKSKRKSILVNYGKILMQIWNNTEYNKLAVTINNGILPLTNNTKDNDNNDGLIRTYSVVICHFICDYDEEDVKVFQTKPSLLPNPIWNETFLFNYNELIKDAKLEIFVYDTKTLNSSFLPFENFRGMIDLTLSDIKLNDEPRWYELKVLLIIVLNQKSLLF